MDSQACTKTTYPIPATPHFLRVDLADRTRIWASARALERSGDIPDILHALETGGYLFAENDRISTWYGFDYEPILDSEHCGARLAIVLLRLAAPDAPAANLHLDLMGRC